MHLIAEGEVTICEENKGQKLELATLGAGEFFGDISLFDTGPCSAHVITTIPSIFIKITQLNLNVLKVDRPAAVAGFLRNLAHAMVRRIRMDNRKYEKTVR
jgi:CRP-like cAMP-binding protein